MDKTEKKIKKKVSIKVIIIQFSMIVFFTITWLNALIFGIGVFYLWYFLFQFLGLVVFSIILLYFKGNPDQPLDLKYTQLIGNLIKNTIDITTIQLERNSPAVIYFRKIMQDALVYVWRDVKTHPELDQKTLEEVEKYVYDKLEEGND